MKRHNYNKQVAERIDMAIGDVIKQKLKESGHTVVWFAKALKCSRTNVYKIFKKTSIETDELFVICEILEYDFFRLYSKELHKMTKNKILKQDI